MFDRCNLAEVALANVCAHGGRNTIRFARLVSRGTTAGECNFIDLAEVPPGASIGPHRHASDEEEFYLVLAGEGEMSRGEERFSVRAGDLIRNPPGERHSLENTGLEPLRLFVFEVRVGTEGGTRL